MDIKITSKGQPPPPKTTANTPGRLPKIKGNVPFLEDLTPEVAIPEEREAEVEFYNLIRRLKIKQDDYSTFIFSTLLTQKGKELARKGFG